MNAQNTVMPSRATHTAPPVPDRAVLRPKVMKRLDDGVGGETLTLVVAPPGFGKTVLLSQWAARQSGSRVAWLSFDARDNNGVRLAAHLVDAINILEPRLGHQTLERVEDSGAAMGENFLDRLLD